MSAVRKGRVEYGARAFEQDASHAIRGDVVRGLIELITNADDAYAGVPGGILVRVCKNNDEEMPIEILVKDHAIGLDATGLERHFSVLGGEKSPGQDSEHVRGLLGRGAKDVASLGEVWFEAIKADKYSRMVLRSSGEWELTHENLPATVELRGSLGLDADQNGLTATLLINKRNKAPSRNQLQEKLSNHAQLRDLVRRRNVRLQDEREGMFTTLLEGKPLRGEVVVDKELRLHGWDESVHLRVRRLPQKISGNVNEYSEHGLLVRSGATIFENTWFDLDGRPEANFFAGELTAPQAIDIIRAYDRGDHDLGGSIRLLSRDRDGLAHQHPFRKEIARVIAAEVRPLFDSLASQMDAQRKQGANLSRAFKVASDALKEEVNSILEEIEETNLQGGSGADEVLELMLIPPRRVALLGEQFSFTLRAKSVTEMPIDVSVDQTSSDDVVSAFAASEAEWAPHPRLQAFQTQVLVTTGLEVGTATLRVQFGEHVARAEIVVAEPEVSDEPVPEVLEMTPRRATVAPTRGKRLTLRAPIEYADQIVTLVYEGVTLDETPTSVVMRAETTGRWVTGVVRAKASMQRGEGTLRAETGDGQMAESVIVVDETAGRGGLSIDFELTAHKSPNRRVELQSDQGNIRIRIYASDPTFAGVFGHYVDSQSSFAQEDSAQARAVIAEVVAGELAAHLTELDYARHPERLNDAPRVIRRRTEFANKFLITLHRALKPTT